MKKHPIYLISLVLCCTFLTSRAGALSNSDWSGLIRDCENLIREKMESDHIVGVSVLILAGDSVVWKNGFGYADLENKVPMTDHTVANIASVTKTFTALAVMQLYEKGLLDIDRPLNEYLPEFSPRTRGENLDQLTVRSVITHSSGIQSDVLKNGDLGSGKYTDVLGYINDSYLMSPPGLVESYSNSGYNILGSLIREVSKEDYPEYIKNHIMVPLGMNSSGFITDSLENRTRVYSGGKRLKEYGYRDIASGGIYTDLNDLVRYARGLMDAYHGLDSSLIGTRIIREMFSLQGARVLIESNKKGLGWFMYRNDSAFALTHAGDGAFGHAELCLVPEKKAAVMILINSAEGEPLRRDFCGTVLKEYGFSVPDIIAPPVIAEVRRKISPLSLPEDLLAEHTGDYSPGFSFSTVSLADGKLIMDRDNKRFILQALSETEFMPCELTEEGEEVPREQERYCFMDCGAYHILFHKAGKREFLLGYRLNKFDPSAMDRRLGIYEHFGYQLLVGDTKFRGAELYLAGDRVLMLKLIAYDGEYAFPLNVISDEYATTSGLGTGFAYTVKFTGNDKYDVVDFGGITFRKQK